MSISSTGYFELTGIRSSIKTVVAAFNTALMETRIKLFETECICTAMVDASAHCTTADVEWATADWVD